jgi:hypothetical protein
MSNAGCITISGCDIFYRAIVTKTAWSWCINRYIDQWNRVKDAEKVYTITTS